MLSRKPTTSAYTQIFHMLDRAFAPSISESNLVKNLRNKGEISFDLVLEKNGEVLAYVCYSAAYDNRKSKIGYHLAPVAVLPQRQRQGLGKQIIRESLLAMGKTEPVYVLGDPEYYSRFGFRLDKTQKCVFDPEGNHFMVLSDNPLPPRDVLYEEEFYELT